MRFFTGTYTSLGGHGISMCHLVEGEMTRLNLANDLNDPIYVILSNDAKQLYAVGCDDLGEGMAASYRIEDDRMILCSKQYTKGRDACHLALSSDERFLYVANYRNGSVSVFPVYDGVLMECIQLIEHHGCGPIPIRQEAAHTHQCLFRPGTNELFVCDLGMDKVMVYQQDTEGGKLSFEKEIIMPSGMGPRHLVFSNTDSFYVTGELDNYVRRCEYIENEWIITGEISTIPETYSGNSLSAAIRLHDGKLYVSNRGHDSLCEITLDESGNMMDAVCTPTGGEFPRDFAITPQGILVAHQNSGGIVVRNGSVLPMDGAVCICIDHTAS